MDPVTTLIGIAAILYGLYTVYVRVRNPSKLGKLEAMKKQRGDTAGSIIPLLAYSIMPLALGVVALAIGLSGGSLL
jgi:hypothetical protein